MTTLRIATIALLACTVTACIPSAPPCPVDDSNAAAANAGCFVVDGQVDERRLLVVRGPTGKLAIPGGGTEPGESPRCTAHRETWEETGLDVVPEALVKVFDNGFHLFRCRIHEDSGDIDPPLRFEIDEAFWLAPADFHQHSWRFPEQADAMAGWINDEGSQTMHKAVIEFLQATTGKRNLPTQELAPLQAPDWTPPQKALFEALASLDENGTKPLGMLQTVAHHGPLFDGFLTLSTLLGAQTMISPREREILALRAAWRGESVYEWAHHYDYGLEAGLSEQAMTSLLEGEIAADWQEEERLLIEAVDQMHAQPALDKATLDALKKHYSEAEIVEILFIINQYLGLSKFANSLGVELEPGYSGETSP